jgi:hypothetical protein
LTKAQGQGKSLLTPAFALKGRNEIAQGNALGKSRHKTPALKGRKTSVADYSALSGNAVKDFIPGKLGFS